MLAWSLISSHAATTSLRFSGRVVRPAVIRSISRLYSSRRAASSAARRIDSRSNLSRCFAVTARSMAARSAASALSRSAFRRLSMRRKRVRSAMFSSAMTRTMSAPSNDELSSRHGINIRKTSAYSAGVPGIFFGQNLRAAS